MLHILFRNKGFSVLFCLLFLVTVGFCHLPLRIEGEEISADRGICFYWEEAPGEGNADTRILYLCASFPFLVDPDSREDFAVLLRFETDDAWYLSSAEGTGEHGELRVTVGSRGILLDGTLPKGESVSLVRTEWKRSGDGSFFLRCRQTEDDRLYVRGKDGIIRDYGFSVAEVTSDPETVTTHPISTEGSPCTDPAETCAATDATEETKGISETEACDTRDDGPLETPSHEPEEPTIYVGCQETRVRDGEYVVRLLFSGDRYPAVFVEGGGSICVSISQLTEVEIWDGDTCLNVVLQAENGFLACTFRHLLADRTYTFRFFSSDEIVEVCYKDGVYQGMYCNSVRK